MFEQVLFQVSESYVNELVAVVEYRHIFGMVFDEEGIISMKREMAVFHHVEDTIRARYPKFRLKIIACALKFLGVDHLNSQIAFMKEFDHDVGEDKMIVGIDAVCEEDYNIPVDKFLDALYAAKQMFGDRLQVIMHAGESNSRHNLELYDAILLGAKRIGHGFALAKHPALIALVKKNNICIEANPVSNRVLGYTHDLRCHPTRGLLQQGVKVSLSSDDHGFWDSKGVTFDYLMAYIAWDLNLSDLRQLISNSIEFASICEADKIQVRSFADHKWQHFISAVRGMF